MIALVLACVFALIAAAAAATVAFSPTKAALAVASVALSVALIALALFASGVRALFWIAPTYLFLDIVVLYFIFATGLRAGEARQLRSRAKLLVATAVSLTLVIFSMAAWELWQMPADAATVAGTAMDSVHLLLWESNRPIVVLCFLLLAPASIGALLMVRQRN